MRHFCVVALVLFSAFAAITAQAAEIHSDDHLMQLPGYDPADEHRILPPAVLLGGQPTSAPLRVHYDQLTDFDPSLLNKLAQAETMLNKLFASPQFFAAVMNHQYQGQKYFVQNRGYSNEEIYALLHLGEEVLSPVADNTMNLELKAYYEDSNTVGYTFTKSKTIYVNRKFYDRYSPAQIARNLMHEWLHKAGFSHDVQATARRPYSVPYAFGKIAETIGRNL